MKYCSFRRGELSDGVKSCTEAGRACPQAREHGGKTEGGAGRVFRRLFCGFLVIAVFAAGTFAAPAYPGAAGSAYADSIVDKPMIDAGNYHSVYLYTDGTVAAVGSSVRSEYANRGLRCDVSGWTDIVEISAASHTVGLRSDGTVVATGVDRYGQCSVDGWTNMVSVSAGDNSTLGLRSDGTVRAIGDNHLGQCNVSDWRDIIQVSAGGETSYGLRSNGKVMAAGGNRSGQRDVSAWSNIVAISAANYYVVGLKADGTVVTAGISEAWQDRYSTWTDIVAISAGSTHMVGLRSNGTVVACGRNDRNQCNVGDWTDICSVSVGMYFSLGMKSDGSLVAAGDNSFGQLGIVDFAEDLTYGGRGEFDQGRNGSQQGAGKLKYPISEEDAYIVYKNYFGYEMVADESIMVEAFHTGKGKEEVLLFTIYHLNENHGGYTWTGEFTVYVNTGVCVRYPDANGATVFQAEDYYY